MADYKRFVSYMYEYEHGVKKKNVGYARVEIRNGECKITIHMQLTGLPEGIFPTYLIHRPEDEMDLVYLGDCTVRNQVMDSRLSTNENNVMDSGYKFSGVGGILLFLNSGVFYATEWDDKPVVLEEVLESLNPERKKASADKAVKNEQEVAAADSDRQQELNVDIADEKEEQQTAFESGENEPDTAHVFEASDMLEKELRERLAAARAARPGQMNSPIYKFPGRWTMKEDVTSYYSNMASNPWELVEKYKQYEADTAQENIPSPDEKIQAAINPGELKEVKWKEQEKWEREQRERDRKEAERKEWERKEAERKERERRDAQQRERERKEAEWKEWERKEQERREQEQEERERKEWERKEIEWKEREQKEGGQKEQEPGEADRSLKGNLIVSRMLEEYPRIYPFEDNEISRCVKIEPKDVATLPSDIRILNNNSFLLHGYYCYHHLIFAEIATRHGCRYILGVPGIFHNRERFMAKMFGFENFKGIKNKELKQGDFGYWYIEVKF